MGYEKCYQVNLNCSEINSKEVKLRVQRKYQVDMNMCFLYCTCVISALNSNKMNPSFIIFSEEGKAKGLARITKIVFSPS